MSNTNSSTLNGLNNIVADNIQCNTLEIETEQGVIDTAELEALDGITTNIQQQFNNLQATGIAALSIGNVVDLPSTSRPYVTLNTQGQFSFGLKSGANGISPFFKIASVNTLAPGANSYVYLSGSTSDIGLNFGIVRGNDGVSPPQVMIGNVTTLPPASKATATLTGSNNNILNLGIPQGLNGVPINPEFSIGPINKLKFGGLPSVTIDNTDVLKPILNFTLVEGPQGEQGIQGERGPKGDRGDRGPNGSDADAKGLIAAEAVVTGLAIGAVKLIADGAALGVVTNGGLITTLTGRVTVNEGRLDILENKTFYQTSNIISNKTSFSSSLSINNGISDRTRFETDGSAFLTGSVSLGSNNGGQTHNISGSTLNLNTRNLNINSNLTINNAFINQF